MRSLIALRLAVTLGAISYAGTSSLHADVIYWDGGDGSWNNLASWSASPIATTPDPGTVPGAADDAIFNISTAIVLSNIALDADQSVNGLIFNNGKTTNLLGNTADTTARALTIGSGGITTADSARAVTIGGIPGTFGAVNVALGADQTWNTNSKAMTLTVPGIISGSVNLTKAGNGTLVLSGDNTFDGVVTVTKGFLSLTSIADGSLPSTLGASTNAAANLLLGHGTTLKYTGPAASSDRSFTINGTANNHRATLDASGSGALNLTSPDTPAYGTPNQPRALTLAGTNTDDNTLSALIANNGTGATTLVKVGQGTWVLNGSTANTSTGPTDVNGGTLALDFENLATPTNLMLTTSALRFGGGTLELRGKDGDASSQAFGNPTFNSQAGSGISITGGSGSTMDLTLGNTWTRNVGSTINVKLGAGGSLNSSPITANGLVVGSGNIAFATVNGTDWAKVSAGKVVAFDSGDYTTTFPTSGSSDIVNYSLTGSGSVSSSQTAHTLKIDTSAIGQSLVIDPDQTFTLRGGGLLFTGADDYSIAGGTLRGSGGTQKNLVIHQFGGGNLTIDSVIENNVDASELVKSGPGTLTLGSANTHTGITYVGGGGTLVLKNELALQSSRLILNDAQLVFDSSVASNAFTLGGGLLTTIAGPGYDVVLENNAAIPEPIALTLNITGLTNLAGAFSGSGSLIKEGAATLRLNGPNTFSGGLIINQGTVWTNVPGFFEQNDSYLGGDSDGNVQVTVNTGGNLAMNRNNITGTLTLNGGSIESSNGAGPATWNGSIILQQTSSFLPGGDGSLIVNAEISGPGGLSRIAARDNARLILTKANTFTGDTVWAVTNSTFELNHPLALQNSTLNTASSLAGVGNEERGFQTNQTTLTFGGFSGDKDLKSLFATNATAGGYDNLTNITLNTDTGTTDYSGGLADGATAIALTKIGAGTQTLSGANTYTGGTTVTAGTLTINGSLGDATATISGGTLDGSGTLTFNVDGSTTDLVTLTGGSFNIAGLTVNINPTGAGLTEAEYVLVDATGGGTLSGATFAGLTGATGYALDYETPNQIKLIQTGTSFATWIGGFGLDPAEQGFGFDADGDGIPNGVEAWFGTDPSIGGPGLTQVAKSGSTVTFVHPEADPALIDVTGSYEWSLDLTTWNASAATEGGTTVTIAPLQNDPTPGTTTVTATIIGTEPAKLFVRAVATQP